MHWNDIFCQNIHTVTTLQLICNYSHVIYCNISNSAFYIINYVHILKVTVCTVQTHMTVWLFGMKQNIFPYIIQWDLQPLTNKDCNYSKKSKLFKLSLLDNNQYLFVCGIHMLVIKIFFIMNIICQGITILCHICKHDLMPVIICENDRHLLTPYNVIFSNMIVILSHLSYIFY